MGALSHYLEAAGIATTQVSLVREHTAAMMPPRALWVSFPLGRPLGVPNDAAFQRDVLLAALRLLERPAGPVLEDYPLDAPAVEAEVEQPVACPVSFAQALSGDPAEDFLQEMAALKPWYDIALERHGRSTVGLSGLLPDEAARYIRDFIKDPQRAPYRAELAPGLALRLACEDVKAFYLEACSAQPGAHSHEALFTWFWTQTTAAKAYRRLREVCIQHMDNSVRAFGQGNLVPRAVLHAPQQ